MKLNYFVLLLGLLLCNHSLSAQQTANVERDHILSIGLLSYVYTNWQDSAGVGRGYNIGALLFDPAKDSIVGWNLNSVRESEVGKTAHAEVGLMQKLIKDKRTLKGLHIVTTLEPCMMCSGMMTFLETDSVKYIQTDPEYGKNIERLAADYAGQPGNERSKHIKSVRAISGNYGSALEELYAAFRLDERNKDKSMADFLHNSVAKEVYKAAYEELQQTTNFKFKKNLKLLSQIKEYINKNDYEKRRF